MNEIIKELSELALENRELAEQPTDTIMGNLQAVAYEAKALAYTEAITIVQKHLK